jgi:ATP-dependent DNA ligase
MVRSSGGARNRIFHATDYGVKVATNPIAKSPTLEDAPENNYPDLDGGGGLVEGPVSLMRLIEVDYDEFSKTGIDALPSRKALSEDMIAVEKKYDGWLCQVAGGRIYSRRGIELTENFLDIAREVENFRGEHLIGELVYWDHIAGKMDEPSVTRVAGTESPDQAVRKMKELESTGFFQIVLFDIIAKKNRDISKLPFEERRKILEDIVETEDDRRERVTKSPIYDFSEWKRIFETAISVGGEGIVLKNMEAPYFWNPMGLREPRPLGTQWKVKAVHTDDFVVFSWRKSDKDKVLLRFGQFCKGEIVEVGEVNNLSREREKEVIELLEHGPFVAEIEFQERYKRYPGRLRNPVFKRIRLDKPIESASLPKEYC